MSDPRLSFVVPAFNAEATIGDTLSSIRAQTIDAWEAVVIDDGSTDATADVAGATGDSRVRVVRQANRGLAGARNAGHGEARADRVCFVDADDRVAPGFAERMAGALGEHDLVACGHRMVGPGLESLGWTVRPGRTDATVERMLSVNPFVVGAVAMRRDAPERMGIGSRPFDETLPVHEDWDLWLRLTGAGASWAAPVDEPLFEYRIRPGSMSADLDLMWRTGLRVISRAPADATEKAAARRSWTIRCLARGVARADAAHTEALCAFLCAFDDAEVGLLASSLRWALQREDVVGPARVGEQEASWQVRVGSMLDAPLAMAVLERLDLRSRDWDAMARALLARCGRDQRLVLYAMGRNGRSLLAALRARPEFAGALCVDDDAEIRAPGAMMVRPEDLRPSDLVVVTPNDAKPILARLRDHAQVLTLADLSTLASASA